LILFLRSSRQKFFIPLTSGIPAHVIKTSVRCTKDCFPSFLRLFRAKTLVLLFRTGPGQGHVPFDPRPHLLLTGPGRGAHPAETYPGRVSSPFQHRLPPFDPNATSPMTSDNALRGPPFLCKDFCAPVIQIRSFSVLPKPRYLFS